MAITTATTTTTTTVNKSIYCSFLLIFLSTTIQIQQVNTLPAFLYNIASSLTNSQATPSPTPAQNLNNNNNNNNNVDGNNAIINQQQQANVDALVGAGSSHQSSLSSGGSIVATAPASLQQSQLSQQSQQQQQQQHKQDQLSAPLNTNDQQQLLQKAANGLQQQLSSMQTQAQRQLAGQNPKFHMLEVLSNMGKAIQQQLLSPNGSIQIITSPALGTTANNKKNEYQAFASADQPPANAVNNKAAPQAGPTGFLNAATTPAISGNYREQGEQIRQDIVRRAGQLQQVLSSSMDAIKDKGDVIVKRLLEQLNSRLDLAKSKADKIINEPATNEVAIKTLNAINQGLHNLNNIITNIVNRFDLTASKDASASQKIVAGLAALNGPNGQEKLRQQFQSLANSANGLSVSPALTNHHSQPNQPNVVQPNGVQQQASIIKKD